MNKLIIGGLGVGKTTLIIDEIIPTINILGLDYVVFDFVDEYESLLRDKSKIRSLRSSGIELKKEFLSYVDATNNETVLIIDNAKLLYFPNDVGGGFVWLKQALKKRKIVLVFQQIRDFQHSQFPRFDDAYIFSTNDANSLRESFIRELKNLNVNVIIKER